MPPSLCPSQGHGVSPMVVWEMVPPEAMRLSVCSKRGSPRTGHYIVFPFPTFSLSCLSLALFPLSGLLPSTLCQLILQLSADHILAFCEKPPLFYILIALYTFPSYNLFISIKLHSSFMQLYVMKGSAAE